MTSLRFLYRAAKYRWRNDRQELDLIRSKLPLGGIAVDIGAHKGAYLYWMQRWAGPEGKIWAFEPQAILANYLRHISTPWPQVEIREEAISSPGFQTASLLLPPGANGSSSGARISHTNSPQGQTVKAVSLDVWFEIRPPSHVIKCDCEGHELAVFQGATQLRASHHPALLFECEARHRDQHGIQPVFDFLHTFGYRGWRVDPKGVNAPSAPPSGPAVDGRSHSRRWELEAELARVDREFEMVREQCLMRGKHGHTYEPTEGMGVAGVLFLILWVSMCIFMTVECAEQAGFVALIPAGIGIVFVVSVVSGSARRREKLNRLTAARAQWQRDRSDILGRLGVTG